MKYSSISPSVKYLLFLLFASVFGLQSQAQLGSTHYIPPLHTTAQFEEHWIYVSTPIATPFNVTVEDGSGNLLTTLTISQGNPASWEIPINGAGLSDVSVGKGDLNIALPGHGLVLSGSELFYTSLRVRHDFHAGYMTAKGEDALGVSFRVGHAPVNPGNGSPNNFYAGIMATEDGTPVRISEYDPGVIFESGLGPISPDVINVTLDAGESYVVSGEDGNGTNNTGFIGALIESLDPDKPIVVNSGNLTGNMPGTPSGNRDFLIDQIVSIDALGVDPSEYIVIRGDGIDRQERPMVLAVNDGTDITINGAASPLTTINAGEFFIIDPTEWNVGVDHQNMFIATSQPAYVYQFLAGTDSNEATPGMNFIPPLSCFFQRYVDLIPDVDRVSPSAGGYTGDIMIVAEAGSTIEVNGAPIAEAPQPVPGTTIWESYRIAGGTGNVSITSDGPMAAGLFGRNNFAGFAGYYSGFAVNPEDTELDVCSNDGPTDLFPLISGNPPAGGVWTPALSGGDGVFVPGTDPEGIYNYSINSACAVVNVDVTVSVTPSPFAGLPLDLDLCDEADDDGFTVFNLLLNEAAIMDINDPANHTISYHLSAADADSNTAPIATPGTFTNTVMGGQTIFARLEEDNNTTCADIAQFDITVYSEAVANPVLDWDVCDDNNDDTFIFDLSTRDSEALGGQDPAAYLVSYHTSQADADLGSNPLPTMYTNTTVPEQIFVRVENVSSSTCFDTGSFEIGVFDTPLANTAADIDACDDDGDGFFDFDLAAKTSEILGGQSSADFTVTYHSSQADADANVNPLPTPYTNITSPETIFARIENNAATTCFDTSTFDITVFDGGTANVATDFLVCDTDNNGVFAFDLTTKDSEILGGQSPGDYTISYHTSQADADSDSNPLVSPYSNTSNPQTIFARIENNNNVVCFDTSSFSLEVFDSPTANVANDMNVCDTDNDGSFAFDLDSQTTQILGGQSAATYTVSYHASQADADADANPLTSPHTNTSNPQTIFARIENTSNSDCFDTSSFVIEVFDGATANATTDMLECDTNNDGSFAFDLTTKDAEILGGQSAANFSITYHESQADADGNLNALTSPYTNTSNPQTIFARIENNGFTDCYDTTTFSIEVFDSPTANVAADMDVCDTDNDGSFAFDLTSQDAQILGGQSAASYTISYHASQADADAASNPLASPHTNTSNPQTIFARIENTANDACFDTSFFAIEVFDSAVANATTDILECDSNNDGSFAFDLTAKDTEILGGQSAANFSISYHASQADADANLNALSSPYTNTSNPQTIFARIENNGFTDCFDTTSFSIEVFDTPTANATNDDVICDDDNDGFWIFDLTDHDADILGGQLASQYVITYHLSQADADADANPIASPYTNVSNPQTIVARIENVDNSTCFDTGSFDLIINDTPDAFDATIPLVICSLAPTASFDLSSVIADVTGGASGVTVSFHGSLADANNDVSPLPDPYTSATATIFARVEDDVTSCHNTSTVDLVVLAQPERRDQNASLCSDTATATFDLSQFTDDIINGAANVSVTYHATNADALAGVNALPLSYATTTTVIYARSEGTFSLRTCENVSEVSLRVNLNPVANDVEIDECSDTDTASFNLNGLSSQIRGGAPNRTLTFHVSLADAEAGLNPLTLPYSSVDAIIFARVVNNTTMCHSTSEVQLHVREFPTYTERLLVRQCLSNGIATFDLAGEKARLQAANPNLVFRFFPTIADANNETNQLPGSLVSADQVIHTRISFSTSDCFIIKPMTLEVVETPVNEVEAIICIGDGYTLPSGTVVNQPGIYPETIQQGTENCDLEIVTTLVLGEILFPDVFTPNGSGVNDTFRPMPNEQCSLFVDSYSLIIWNRWGEKVFETSDYTEGWNGLHNGENAIAGYYVWIANYTFEGQDVEQKGGLTLIR